jgi:hypothetical protein
MTTIKIKEEYKSIVIRMLNNFCLFMYDVSYSKSHFVVVSITNIMHRIFYAHPRFSILT